MQRDEQNRVVLPEDLLRAVAMVDVIVDDRHAADAVNGLHVACSDGDVVDEAEAHRALRERVVAGRADEREAVPVDGRQRAPGRE
jgi:hypothetical protein